MAGILSTPNSSAFALSAKVVHLGRQLVGKLGDFLDQLPGLGTEFALELLRKHDHAYRAGQIHQLLLHVLRNLLTQQRHLPLLAIC